jgi:hypothetical protein
VHPVSYAIDRLMNRSSTPSTSPDRENKSPNAGVV